MSVKLAFMLIYFLLVTFSLYYLFLYILTEQKKGKLPKKEPRVLFLIPAYNEEKNIEKAVRSALSQDFGKVEVLVIDDGSKDKTAELAKAAGAKVFRKENEGNKARALNFALRRINLDSYDFIVVLDADTTVPKNYLRNILPYFDKKNVVAVVPAILPSNAENIVEKMQKVEYLISNFSREVYAVSSTLNACPTGTIIRASIFKELGLFDEQSVTEDLEYGMRIVKKGYSIAFAPDVKVLSEVPSSLFGAVKQRLRWYFGFVRESFRYLDVFLKKGINYLLIQAVFWVNLFAFLLIIWLQIKNFLNELAFNIATGFDIGYYLHNFELPRLIELLANSISWLFAFSLLMLLVTSFIASVKYKERLGKETGAYIAIWWLVIGITQLKAFIYYLLGGSAKWWR